MMIDYVIGRAIVILYALVCGVLDYKYMKIDVRIFAVMLFEIIVFYVCMVMMKLELRTMDIVLGCIPGIMIGIASKITEGEIGIGDAVFFILLGCAAGFGVSVLIIVLAILLCSSIGVILNIKKPGAYKRLPLLSVSMPLTVLILMVV